MESRVCVMSLDSERSDWSAAERFAEDLRPCMAIFASGTPREDAPLT